MANTTQDPREPKQAPGNADSMPLDYRERNPDSSSNSTPFRYNPTVSSTKGKSGNSGGTPTASGSGNSGSSQTSPNSGNSGSSSTVPGAEPSVYRPGGDKPARGFGLFNNRRRMLITAFGATGVGAIIFAAFMFLLPLRVVSIIENLDSHYSAGTNYATNREEEELESTYIKRDVLPSLKNKLSIPGERCGSSGVVSTIDRNCRTVVTGSGLVANLFKAWSQARLENNLAEKGIEFQRVGNNYLLKAPGLGVGDGTYNVNAFADDATGESLPDFMAKDGQFAKFSSSKDFKAAVSAKLDSALENETKFKEVRTKYLVAKLIEQKYGIKRCIFACGTRRDFNDWKNKKTAAAVIKAQRVLQPNNKIVQLVLTCIATTNSTTPPCDVVKPKDVSDPGDGDATAEPDVTADGCQTNCIDNGEPLGSAETGIDSVATEVAADFTLDNADDIAKAQQLYQDLAGKGGYKAFYARQLITSLVSAGGASDEASEAAGNAASKVATADVPFLGEVLLLAQLNNMALTAGTILPAMGYMMQEQTMVHTYATYRTFADEVRDPGAVKDAAIVGSMNDSLGGGNQDSGNKDDPEIGGTASAEESPLYNSILNSSGTASTTTAFNSLFGTAYAASSPSDYLCADNKPLPAGQLVCPEEKADSPAKIKVNDITSKEPAALVQATNIASTINSLITSVVGKIAGALRIDKLIGDAFSGLTSIGPIKDLASQVSGFLSDNFLPPTPTGTNVSGARTVDLVAGGNDVTAADYNHNGLGGVALTPDQSEALLTTQQQEDKLQESNQPLLAQLFSTSSPHSLTSKIATAMPASLTDAQTDMASFFSHPLSGIETVFGALFGGHRAFADASAQPDPFDITQYGYPTNDPIFSQDPEAYWDAHCTTNAETVAWNQAAADNSSSNTLHTADNLQPSQGGGASPTSDPTGTNPCLLIQASVVSAGGIYDSSFLTPYEDSSTGSSSPTTAPSSTSLPSGTAQELAKQILSNPNIGYEFDAKEDMQDAAAGKAGTAGVPLSATLLQLMAELAQKHKFTISAVESHGQGHCNGQTKSTCPTDPHYTGDAFDIVNVDGDPTGDSGIGRTASDINVINELAPLMPSGSRFGQEQCGTTPTLPKGISTFTGDPCSHLHIDVPVGTS